MCIVGTLPAGRRGANFFLCSAVLMQHGLGCPVSAALDTAASAAAVRATTSEAFGGLWDQDALMIGKTSRAVAMKCARPTTPSTANAAKDTVSTVMPSFGL